MEVVLIQCGMKRSSKFLTNIFSGNIASTKSPYQYPYFIGIISTYMYHRQCCHTLAFGGKKQGGGDQNSRIGNPMAGT
jgi:hypothetical protein